MLYVVSKIFYLANFKNKATTVSVMNIILQKISEARIGKFLPCS